MAEHFMINTLQFKGNKIRIFRWQVVTNTAVIQQVNLKTEYISSLQNNVDIIAVLWKQSGFRF